MATKKKNKYNKKSSKKSNKKINEENFVSIILCTILAVALVFFVVNLVNSNKEEPKDPIDLPSKGNVDVTSSSSGKSSSSIIESSTIRVDDVNNDVSKVETPEYNIPAPNDGKYNEDDFDARQEQGGNLVPTENRLAKAKALADKQLADKNLGFNADNTWWKGYDYEDKTGYTFYYMTLVGGKYGQFDFHVVVSPEFDKVTDTYGEMLKQNS